MSSSWASALVFAAVAATAAAAPGPDWGGGAGAQSGGPIAAAYPQPKYPSYGPDPALMIGDGYTTAYLNATLLGLTNSTEDQKLEKEFYQKFQSSLIYDCGRRPMEGKYGEGHVGLAHGQVVHIASRGPADDHSGCERPFEGTQPIPAHGPWIALVKRGKCNFDDKLQNAFDSKASGVLIYNDRDSVTLEKMKLSTNKNRNISAVFTYKIKGEELAKLVDSGVKVMLQISVATYCVQAPNMNKTSVLFVTISFIVLMVMSLSWLVFYYIQRFRYMNAKDRLSKRLCCAAKKALSKIPIKNLKSEDREIQGDGECCAICIEPYKISDTLRILPCRHDFHKSCIDPWLLEHRTCPMCKMDILKYYGFVFTGSQESILQLDNEERPTVAISSLPPQMSRTDSYDASAHSARSSRASSPDEMTPTLHQSAISGSMSGEATSPARFSSYPHSSSDPALYSSAGGGGGGKRTPSGARRTAPNSIRQHHHPQQPQQPQQQQVVTTVVSSRHIDDNELRDAV